MFPFTKKSGVTIGLEFLPEGIATAVKNESGGNTPVLDFIPSETLELQKPLLKEWVARNKYTNAITNVVLSANSYQVLLVEPPDVPEDELREAIRWRLKDLLNIPLAQAVLDVFALPEDGVRGNKKMVYVVAVERKIIEGIMATIKFAGLCLESVDIIEMAIRNVAYSVMLDEQKGRGVAIARLSQGNGSVFLYREGNMYLARNFKLDYNGGLLDDLPQESLALELQRSVDYYERQMGQAPPAAVFVCGENVLEDKIGAVLKSSFATPVQHLNPLTLIDSKLGGAPGVGGATKDSHQDGEAQDEDNKMDEGVVQLCLGAMGGALRGQVTAHAAD